MLPKLEGFAAALLGQLDETALGAVVSDLEALSTTVLSRGDLSAVLSDTSITGVARGNVLRDLLRGKVRAESERLAVYAAQQVPAQEVPHALDELAHVAVDFRATQRWSFAGLSLLDARRRVAGYADALLSELSVDEYSNIEDDLFRWARTVEGNDDLRRVLLDRDAALESRLGLSDQLLSGKVSAPSLALAHFTVVGGRPRDVVGTLDFLVNYVAQARDWRVARVHSARALDAASQDQMIASLRALTGKEVELQIAEQPELLGGVLVEIGDLRLDATTRGRLGALRAAVDAQHALEPVSNRID